MANTPITQTTATPTPSTSLGSRIKVIERKVKQDDGTYQSVYDVVRHHDNGTVQTLCTADLYESAELTASMMGENKASQPETPTTPQPETTPDATNSFWCTTM